MMRHALMRYVAMLTLLAIAVPVQASSNWERLWFNADQRGDKLLLHGDAGAAARVYKDPRRRAYAEMKAGDYQQAASELGKLHDSDSDYNRGNALAKLGNLKGALDAYDAALRTDPKNHDAQHNRDLVEQALKQQQLQQNKQQNGQNKNGQDNKSGGKQGSNSGGADNQSGNNANGANDKNGQQSAGSNASQNSPHNSSDNSSGTGKSSEKSAGQQNAKPGANVNPGTNENPGPGKNQVQQNQQNKPGQSGSGQQGSSANNAAQSGRNSNPGQGGATVGQQAATPGNPSGNRLSGKEPADAAAQARQDAATGLAASKLGMNANPITNAVPADQTAPPSEQQLSKEQWLRSIPDDPGGLLRRKFMIEYLLRQQKAQQ